MTTEEEKALADILRENLDDDDLLLTYTNLPGDSAAENGQGDSGEDGRTSPSRTFRRKNRRWRQLNLKIKVLSCVLLLGVLLGGGFLYANTRNQGVETAASPKKHSTSAGSQKKPAASVTPVPKKPTPTPTPTVTPTPTPVPLPDDWNLILVNPWHPLPEGFTVELASVENGHSVDARIAKDLEKMLADARAQGLSPMICSSYRTMEKQETLYANKVAEYLSQGYTQENAESEAGKWVAVPGTSEHQTGLALDIVSANYQLLDQKQEETPEQKWLMENSYKYGFILRYPNSKRETTGIYYEPWHYRYVGYRIAKEIHEKGICYEEYLESLR